MLQLSVLAPDAILHNARIYTMDARQPLAQAVAIKDGRFLAVGQEAEITPLAAAHTRVVDLQGSTVLPGIFDSHNHLQQVGVKLTRIRLDECRSPAEMMELVRERALETPPGAWIVGEGWNENNFTGEAANRLPTCADIDPATSEHPVILMRFFNTDVVNSVALRRAGINRHTRDPEGGKIERDANGEPNGLLRAGAKLFVRNLLPRPTPAELQTAIHLGCAEMNRYGITSVVDPGLYPWEMAAYQSFFASRAAALPARDEMSPVVRVNMMPSWHGFREEEDAAALDARASALGVRSGLGDEWLRLGGLKMAIDGGTSSHTALMYEPFEGETAVGDFTRMPPVELRRCFALAQELGWDVGIHTCGDRAMDLVVDAFSDVAKAQPLAGRAPQRHPRLLPERPCPGADGRAPHCGRDPADLPLLGGGHDLPRRGRGTRRQLQAGAQVSRPRGRAVRQLGHSQHRVAQPVCGALCAGHTAQQPRPPGGGATRRSAGRRRCTPTRPQGHG